MYRIIWLRLNGPQSFFFLTWLSYGLQFLLSHSITLYFVTFFANLAIMVSATSPMCLCTWARVCAYELQMDYIQFYHYLRLLISSSFVRQFNVYLLDVVWSVAEVTGVIPLLSCFVRLNRGSHSIRTLRHGVHMECVIVTGAATMSEISTTASNWKNFVTYLPLGAPPVSTICSSIVLKEPWQLEWHKICHSFGHRTAIRQQSIRTINSKQIASGKWNCCVQLCYHDSSVRIIIISNC